MKSLTLYKGSGSMMLNFKEATPRTEEERGRNACIFASFAPKIGDKKYDTERNVIISLGYWDITHILHGIDTNFEGLKNSQVRIYHQYGDSKTLTIGPGKEGGTFMWALRSGDISVAVYATTAEMSGGGLGIYGYLKEGALKILKG